MDSIKKRKKVWERKAWALPVEAGRTEKFYSRWH